MVNFQVFQSNLNITPIYNIISMKLALNIITGHNEGAPLGLWLNGHYCIREKGRGGKGTARGRGIGNPGCPQP